jgi:hypothetical protein
MADPAFAIFNWTMRQAIGRFQFAFKYVVPKAFLKMTFQSTEVLLRLEPTTSSALLNRESSNWTTDDKWRLLVQVLRHGDDFDAVAEHTHLRRSPQDCERMHGAFRILLRPAEQTHHASDASTGQPAEQPYHASDASTVENHMQVWIKAVIYVYGGCTLRKVVCYGY